MDKLKELASKIHCDFKLGFNDHKGYYAIAQTYYLEDHHHADPLGEIDWTKDIWQLQIYINTPISFYACFSNDLEELVDWAIALAEKEAWPEEPDYMSNKTKGAL